VIYAATELLLRKEARRGTGFARVVDFVQALAVYEKFL
jgi:hypothetical protein